MLRGAIDFCDGWRIGGWLYSPEITVRDRLVLAFVDELCVGSGRVDQFRQDLADVGLGDGHCGFNFPVTLAREHDRGRSCIRLDLSDFALLQQGARITDGAEPSVASDMHSAESIEWMRDRGWIDDADAGFLRDLSTTGAHDLATSDPLIEAKRLFALYRQAPVHLQETLVRLDNLADERLRLIEGAAVPFVAIHAPAGEVRLERSAEVRHYACGDGRLLFIDARAPFTGVSGETARVYRAV